MTAPDLIIVAKSRWEPSIRREHALARLAQADRHRVAFLESPVDIRALRRPVTGGWIRRPSVHDAIAVIPRRTLVPAHRGASAARLDGYLLARAIARPRRSEPTTVLATLPWQWPAVAAVTGVRRVLDLADDWAALIPGQAARVRELCRRAAGEADEITVASEHLVEFFGSRAVRVVPNATDAALIAPSPTEPPRRRRRVYVGTLSERLDADLLGALLDRLPGWTVALWGQCRYAGRGDLPGSDLQRLLRRPDGRATCHGAVPRERLAGVLDDADVLLVPSRPGMSRGQDSMKAYDYAARGRPIVTTTAAMEGMASAPPGLRHGADAEALARCVLDAAADDAGSAQQRIMWAAGHTWERRWPQWRAAVFGERATVSPPAGGSATHSLR